jgi:outer membrane protein OmpA-like peptidoglycan-associated protein
MNRKVLGLVGVLVGCGAAMPPKELVDARSAYKKAESGSANRLHPAQVYEAKQALDKAEAKWGADGESPETKDLSYLAQRKAQFAEAQAELTLAEQARAKAENDVKVLTGKALESTTTDLNRTKEQLSQERQALASERQALEREKAARIEAERRARQALDDLAKIAAIKQEQRGMVITLSGAVLFTSGKWELLEAAQIKLNEVAEALKSQTGHDIVIEGHTDSQGNAASNMELSQKRADAVRDYLVKRGIDSARIKGQGIGQTRPIADNTSPEGRANNRRVEIIVQPLKEAR